MLILRLFVLFTIAILSGQTAQAGNGNLPNRVLPPRPKRIAALQQPQPPLRNGLPATMMDSFVLQAAEHADHIYGDEGVTNIPPYESYTVAHRINTGILDQRDRGLTTGHGSNLPDAVGYDEFTGDEWSQSGASGRTAAQGFADGVPKLTPGSGFTWEGNPNASQQVGYAPMYGRGNFPTTDNAPVDTYAMSAADVMRARKALVDGDFFKWNGTQSSQGRSR